jgi:IS5 family transposase
LDEIAELIDWLEIDRYLFPIYRSATGEKAWPPLAMLKILLLSVWYDLSDVKLAEALDDRVSFRRFCGFTASEPTPERTAFVRFRKELARHGIDKVPFEAVTRQLFEKNVMVKTGTMIDAMIIASPNITKVRIRRRSRLLRTLPEPPL